MGRGLVGVVVMGLLVLGCEKVIMETDGKTDAGQDGQADGVVEDGDGSDPVDGDGGQDGGSDQGGDDADPDGSDGDGELDLIGLQVEPEAIAIEVGSSIELHLWGQLRDGTRQSISEGVQWQCSPESLAEVDGDGRLWGLEQGSGQLVARFQGLQSDPVPVQVTEGFYEARGLWITRWNYASVQDVHRVIQQAADAGFNQVYFQVRGTADAYYNSSVEPWAAGLSGVLGRDPGWDPLQEALDAAHAEGLELHAWINSVPAWTCGAGLPSSEGIPHVLQSHPEWSAVNAAGISMLGNCASGYVSLSPGIPEVHEHIRAVVQDMVTHYDVDGVHLDYIRYPGPAYSHDPVSEQRYAQAAEAEPGLTWEDWQRRQINALVGGVYETLATYRPEAVLSAAVWFIRQNVWGWSSVSEGYHDYYQDPWAWTEAGTIDAIVPMIYFPLTSPPGGRLDFASMLADHLDGAAGRFVYAGIHGDYDDFAEIAAQVDTCRDLGAPGFVIFAYPYLVEHDTFDDMADGPNAEACQGTPDMPWR